MGKLAKTRKLFQLPGTNDNSCVSFAERTLTIQCCRVVALGDRSFPVPIGLHSVEGIPMESNVPFTSAGCHRRNSAKDADHTKSILMVFGGFFRLETQMMFRQLCLCKSYYDPKLKKKPEKLLSLLGWPTSASCFVSLPTFIMTS